MVSGSVQRACRLSRSVSVGGALRSRGQYMVATAVNLQTLLRLRLVVGFLGERAQFNWWPTGFFEPSSRLFLEPVFTRGLKLAQYHGITEAGRRHHDENLSLGCRHLFRLPEEIEQDLHSLLQPIFEEGSISTALQNRDAALGYLRRLAPTALEFKEGPIAIGRLEDIGSTHTLEAMAGSYASAFSKNVRTYPYLLD